MTDTLHCEPIKLNLVGIDGNAFALLGSWNRAARKQGRTPAEIKSVLDDSMSGDYNHLLQTLVKHTI